jgi:hypothetical protein
MRVRFAMKAMKAFVEHHPAFNACLIPRGERLFFAAELLAAVKIVTGRDSVQLNADKPAPSACLRLEDILSVAETIDTGAGPKVSQSELQSALGTAIFTDRGAKRLGFVHRTMAECLSARRYTGMELRRLRPLFFQGPVTERHVVPQLAQTASWLCEDHPQFGLAQIQSRRLASAVASSADRGSLSVRQRRNRATSPEPFR